jgi:hypothetical protein
MAKANPLYAAKMQEAAQDNLAAYKDWLNDFTIAIPVGFLVTYTHEIQPHYGLCHHISISIDKLRMLPNEFSVMMLFREFDLMTPDESSDDLRRRIVGYWIEEYANNRKALNFVIPILI